MLHSFGNAQFLHYGNASAHPDFRLRTLACKCHQPILRCRQEYNLFKNFTPSPMLLGLDIRGKECMKGSMSTSSVVMFSFACFTGSAHQVAQCGS